jgi:hypothetical protein
MSHKLKPSRGVAEIGPIERVYSLRSGNDDDHTLQAE